MKPAQPQQGKTADYADYADYAEKQPQIGANWAKNVITYPEAMQWLFALTLPPLRAPSPLPVGEERGLSRRPEQRRRAALGEW